MASLITRFITPGLSLLLTAYGSGRSGPPNGPPPGGCVSTATVVCTQYGQVQGAVVGSFRWKWA
jgi:hypothetical protein